MSVRHILMLIVCGGGLALAGCAPQKETLYQWEGYQTQVYEYFKGVPGDTDQQIAVLEEGLQKISASGKTPPPGYHAQLGLLYSLKGNPNQTMQQFQAEKMLYPESVVFMDFLIANAKK